MSKRQEKKVEPVTIVNEDPIVLVRVINNFNDATDNNRFISAGPNNFYRTNKSRADMLVEAGYAEYEDVAADIVSVDVNKISDTVDNVEDITITNPDVNADDNADPTANPDDNVTGNVDDKTVPDTTDNENPNE